MDWFIYLMWMTFGAYLLWALHKVVTSLEEIANNTRSLVERSRSTGVS